MPEPDPDSRPSHVLPVIVAAQFAGTSLWFAGNAVLPELQAEGGLDTSAVGILTSAVQMGFICGTLIFAFGNIADRLSARAVFLACAVLGAVCNALPVFAPGGLVPLLSLRFATGFFLAGIYPVGMKIAASWYARGLGKALGLLVGALVLGTAFPHLLRTGGVALEWREVLLGVSALAASGGFLLFFTIDDGPHLPRSAPFDARAVPRIFSNPDFRSAAFGYFGHMWELYAFWAFVPLLLGDLHARGAAIDVPLWSFAIIGAGTIGCVGGGQLSQRFGSGPIAAAMLAISGGFCVTASFLPSLPAPVTLGLLLVWGVAVAGDSPQFSTLTAQTAPRERVGTALTVVTCIGFAITVPSVQLVGSIVDPSSPWAAMVVLAPGPALGLLALRRHLWR